MTNPDVVLKQYNPDWVRQFEWEKKRIIEAIGDRTIKIEHIGSTSIQGLGAKPIIDIMVAVKNLEEVSNLIIPLKNIEFEYVPKPEFKDRMFFRKGLWGKGTCHLHICEFNSSEWNDKLLFRDYLRLYPEAAKEYYLLKKQLASEYSFDRLTYTLKKEPFIKHIIEKAKRENADI
ncbi:GrpB family protein [Niallia sp. 01092]|uniref:GrpB family protein n=1 Tax=unclassified Niallia TaxID=2837522 RepID=UPI003FD01E08